MANVRDFEYIAEIARYGSISRAAEALYLSQPTLTKFLQRVEREAGQPLFHRVGKRFILTPAGEVYVARAKSILQLEHQLEQELADLAAMRSGSIRLGTTAGRSSYIARQVAPLFRQEFPGVRLLLHISHTERLMKMMQNNELDMALANCDQDFPALSADFLNLLAKRLPKAGTATPASGAPAKLAAAPAVINKASEYAAKALSTSGRLPHSLPNNLPNSVRRPCTSLSSALPTSLRN